GRWPDQLPYTQLDYPHQDFAVVSSSESHIAEVEGLKQMSVSLGLTLETWTTQSERLAVIRGHRRSESHENFIFSGMAKGRDRLVFGQDEIELYEKPEITESVGDFVSVTNDNHAISIETDYFGIGKVFYYSDGKFACASNRYHLLLLTLKSLDIELSFDRVKARSNLQAVNQPFTQNFSSRMDVRNCYVLPVDQNLTIARGSLNFVDSEIRAVLDGPSDAVPSPLEYKESVERASEEIVSNLRVALTHPRFESVRVDLTGGMDARLIFAALTHLTEFNAKVGVHTADVPSSPNDLKISLALTRNYPFGYDEIPRVV